MKKLVKKTALLALLLFGSLGVGNVNAHTWVVQREEIVNDQICVIISISCDGGGGTNLLTCGSFGQILSELVIVTEDTC